MNIYWLIIDVEFKKPMPVQDRPGDLVYGFIQNVGCTANHKADLESQVRCRIVTSDSSVEQFGYDLNMEISIIDRDDLDEEVYGDPDLVDRIDSDPNQRGIWYVSGRGYYTE